MEGPLGRSGGLCGVRLLVENLAACLSTKVAGFVRPGQKREQIRCQTNIQKPLRRDLEFVQEDSVP